MKDCMWVEKDKTEINFERNLFLVEINMILEKTRAKFS